MPISELIKKRPEGKHDGHQSDDRSWCYQCNCSAPEEEFTENWSYNKCVDEIYELERQGKICCVPSVEEVETFIKEFGVLMGNMIIKEDFCRLAQSIIDFLTKQKE